MASKTTPEILIKEMGKPEEELVRKSIERGGLPTETESEAFVEELNEVVYKLEQIASRVEWIAVADTPSVPVDISLDQLGVLAVLVSDLAHRVEDIQRHTKTVHGSISSLAAIRADQQLALSDG